MKNFAFFLCFLCFLLTSTVHLLLAPYSKVEESFHTQAVHDTLFHLPPKSSSASSIWSVYYEIYGELFASSSALHCSGAAAARADATVPCAILTKFDHLSFPGVVPRSFLPSAVIANFFCRPLLRLQELLLDRVALEPNVVKPLYGLLSRFFVGALNSHASARLALSLRGPPLHRWCFVVVTCMQPHLNFYSTRHLPNTFALLITTHAFAYWFSSNFYLSIALLAFAIVTVRCDIVVLAAPVFISLLVNRRVKFLPGVLVGLTTAAATFLVIVPLDTVM